MSMGWGSGVMPEKMSEKVLSCQEAADCLIPMGMTSENVAEQYNISRDVQDTFAANSYAKALRAQKDGKFRSEIVPVKVGPPSDFLQTHMYTREGIKMLMHVNRLTRSRSSTPSRARKRR